MAPSGCFLPASGIRRHRPRYVRLWGHRKPTNPELYAGTLIAKDILDILDIEPGTRVVVLGHDWGSKIVSRIANIDSERILGFACVSVSYLPPNPTTSYPQFMAYTTNLAGRELFGYWAFFAEDGADKIIMDNFDSFMAAVVGFGVEDAKTHFAQTGAFKSWLLARNPPPLIPSYITQEEFDTQKEIIRETGMTGPLCWYKAAVSSIDMEDCKIIREDRFKIHKPFFYAGANNDAISIPAFGKATMEKYCTKATIKFYDAGHWIILKPPARDELNADLFRWITEISSQ